MSLLQAEPARRPATMVKTRWEAATPCSAGQLNIFGAAGGERSRNNKVRHDVGSRGQPSTGAFKKFSRVLRASLTSCRC